MARNPSATPLAQSLAAISMLEGVLQMLLRKGIATDVEVTSLFHDRASAWENATGWSGSGGVAALLRSMAGDRNFMGESAGSPWFGEDAVLARSTG